MVSLVHIDSLNIDDIIVMDNVLYSLIEKGYCNSNFLAPETSINRCFKWLKAMGTNGKMLYREFPTANTFGSKLMAESQKDYMVNKLN